jgi:O-acetyl-ADP-ribose deacetylase (regulator of RNase III)
MIKYRPLSESADCPFYVKDTKGRNHCFIKYINNLNVILGAINVELEDPEEVWERDCQGECGDNCAFLSLLYDCSESQSEAESPDPYADIEDYDPFANDDEDEEEYEEEYEEESEEDYEEDESAAEEEVVEEEEKKPILVKVKRVTDPYLVNADVLVYPTNSALSIDDDALNKHSRFKVQKECDWYLVNDDVTIGNVYATSNGGDFPGGIIPKRIYHAVVAGPARLVSHHIEPAMIQSLMLAEKEGAEIVALLPCDCSMMDLNEAARLQLSAIKKYAEKANSSKKRNNIRLICIVMEDKDTEAVYKEYYENIFG